jgi:superfamily II DNA/RNA helicase/HKD family nuclease
MPHVIIDNRNIKLVDVINQQLEYAEKVKIAVGYFFLSGIKNIQDKLIAKDENGIYKIQEVRLLIGNTSSIRTIEELAQIHREPERIAHEIDRQKYINVSKRKQHLEDAVEDVRDSLAELDQTDENESLIHLIREMVTSGRLKVKVYLKSRLHAKAYIFDARYPQPQSKGIAIVGSSNLSLAGLTNNTELNVYVHDNGENHAELTRWFNELWNEAEDFNPALMDEVLQSWAAGPVSPYDVYMKTLYTLVKERLEGEDTKEFLWVNEITEALADFQTNAVKQLVRMIKIYNGAFAADVVGVGKSYIGAAVIKHFSITEGIKPLIICPKQLEDMWKRYNAVYSLNAEIVPMSLLIIGDSDLADWNFLVADDRYNDRDFVLIDESHNFRHHSPQRYQVLEDFLQTGDKKILLMTATPRNKSAKDVYNQIKLFHHQDITDLPINPPNLKEYFKKILDENTPADKANSLFRSLLQNILVRRTRLQILKWYGYDSETHNKVDPENFNDYIFGKKRAYILVGGERRFFPKREVKTVSYNIDETYSQLYTKIRKHLGKDKFNYSGSPKEGELTYARFALWHYVVSDKQKEKPYNELHRAGINLRGLMRVLLFKRLESSVYAFRQTISRMTKVHNAFLQSIEHGIIPAGEEAQNILSHSDQLSEVDLIEALQKATKGKYNIADFDVKRLKKHIEHDYDLFVEIYKLVDESAIPPEKDAKLQKLKKILEDEPLNKGKLIIFSESAETVEYLYDNINPDKKPEIQKASSDLDNKSRLVNLFAPKANRYTFKKGEKEISMLISTDVLSEGLNLQDGDKIINYDLHWNPVKIIQRFGRIDRIGSEFDIIYGFNFLPETALDEHLSLHEIVHNRIQEIHDTIGEDSIILDSSEQINTDAMYAIYEENMGQISLFEGEEEILDLNEAEEILRQLRAENPDEYNRITKLRDGIRAAVSEQNDRLFVFSQAGKYNQLFLLDMEGNIVSRDISEILGKLKFHQTKKIRELPKGYNKHIQKVKQLFAEEVKHRFAEQRHSVRLSPAQNYIISELKLMFGRTDNEDLKAQINTFEEVIRKVNRAAVKNELNRIKKNQMTGKPLIQKLTELYTRHNLQEVLESQSIKDERITLPRIISSEMM